MKNRELLAERLYPYAKLPKGEKYIREILAEHDNEFNNNIMEVLYTHRQEIFKKQLFKIKDQEEALLIGLGAAYEVIKSGRFLSEAIEAGAKAINSYKTKTSKAVEYIDEIDYT